MFPILIFQLSNLLFHQRSISLPLVICGGVLLLPCLGKSEEIEAPVTIEAPQEATAKEPAKDPKEEISPTPELIQKILKGEVVEITEENANTATTAKLLESELQLLEANSWGIFDRETQITPLMVATAKKDVDTINALIEAGANRGSTTKPNKLSALAIACRLQHYKAGQALLKEPTAEKFRVNIDLAAQRLDAFADNVNILSCAISSGDTKHPTPLGTYMITEKYGKKKISNLYNANMPFFMRLNLTAVGIHAGELPGYPASKGCIRLPYARAAELSKLVPRGALVTIHN